MGMFKRVGDIISANLSEMIERFEEPEKMLKQAIREMDGSISDATADAAKVVASEKRLAKELAHNQNEVAVWQSRAEQAVAGGDDELARKALHRKQEHVKLATALQDQYDSTKDAADVLRRQLDGMKAKRDEAKRSLATLTVKKKAADVRARASAEAGKAATLNASDAAFAKFDRMRDKVEQAEAEAEAIAELQASDIAASFEESVTADDEIEAQLADLKHRREDQ